MSFEDAVDTANHSALQTILAENENFEQTFNIVTDFDTE
jgi:hypothetical protein